MTSPATEPASGGAPPPARIDFPDGLVGLPALVHHELRAVPDTALFELVSLDDPEMGFIAARAEDVRPGMTDALRRRSVLGDAESLLVLLAVHGEPATVTANLAGPVAVDTGKGTARQLVLEDPEYPLRAPVAELL